MQSHVKNRRFLRYCIVARIIQVVKGAVSPEDENSVKQDKIH